jgi:hypothetical protein
MTRGGAVKGSGSKGCRGADHGQACTKERTGAVAVRAALESAVQLGRRDEVNRQKWPTLRHVGIRYRHRGPASALRKLRTGRGVSRQYLLQLHSMLLHNLGESY